MSHVMRKQDICICENKGADQLCVTAQLISVFVFATWIVQYSQSFKTLACFCDHTDRFVSDLAGNTEDRFSCVAAHDAQL